MSAFKKFIAPAKVRNGEPIWNGMELKFLQKTSKYIMQAQDVTSRLQDIIKIIKPSAQRGGIWTVIFSVSKKNIIYQLAHGWFKGWLGVLFDIPK